MEGQKGPIIPGFPITPMEAETIRRMDGMFRTNIDQSVGYSFPAGKWVDEDSKDKD